MLTHQPALSLQVTDLGRIGYSDALTLQRRINQGVIGGHEPPTLLLLEHDPVITITPRTNRADHLLADARKLTALGIEIAATDRGGEITYHGPGQLVAYPIIPLAPFGLNLSRYMRLLERVVIDTVAGFGIEAFREEGCTGIWVQRRDQGSGIRDQENRIPDARHPIPEARVSKLCALGVRIRRNVTMHGLALNVTTDLSHFQTIVPCGLTGRTVTSMAELLAEDRPSMQSVKRQLAETFNHTLSQSAIATPEPPAP